MPTISDVRYPMLVYNPNTLSLELWDGEVTLTAGTITIGVVDQGAAGASAWKVDGSGVTQPVSGTFFQATQPVSAAALPLPSGAATSANQTTELASLSSIDTKLSSQATAANQTTELASLSSIDTKLTSQATAANQAMEIASLASLVTSLAQLTVTPGASGASATGPLMQAIVSDTPGTYIDGAVEPFSLTNQGRLRVSAVQADIEQVWQHTLENPWAQPDPWAQESSYV